jgi:hypothetical protein
LRIFTAGIIATILVVSIGVGMIAPVFLTDAASKDKLNVALMIDLGNASNDTWAKEVVHLLDSEVIRATVFASGDYAYTHPELIIGLGEAVDLGSQTQTYSNLTEIPDYTLQLGEVADGKSAIDSVAGVESRIFRAPYGSTNDDVYSILSRSGILADFSYSDHYNVWYNGQFIRMDLPVYTLSAENVLEVSSLVKQGESDTVIVIVDEVCPSQVLSQLLASMDQGQFHLVNASDLLGFSVTIRR